MNPKYDLDMKEWKPYEQLLDLTKEEIIARHIKIVKRLFEYVGLFMFLFLVCFLGFVIMACKYHMCCV